MQKITSVKGLQQAIAQLESDQKRQAVLLKKQFALTAESLNPMNLFTGILKDILTSPFVLLFGIDKIKTYGHRIIDKISARFFST